jgi:hypothetical protein
MAFEINYPHPQMTDDEINVEMNWAGKGMASVMGFVFASSSALSRRTFSEIFFTDRRHSTIGCRGGSVWHIAFEH